jgi:phosphate transport system substrate-binding protein
MQRRAIALLLAALAMACVQEDRKQQPAKAAKSSESGRIAIAGSEAMRHLGAQLAAAYGKKHSGVKIDVAGGGTSGGIAALASGSADIAQASRPLTPEERATIEQRRGAKVEEIPLAYDAVAIYVNDANPVQQLSLRQLAALVSGTAKSWKEVGGPNAPVTLYGEADANGFTSLIGVAQAPQPQRDFAEPRGAIAAAAADPNGLAWAHLVPQGRARVVWIQRADGGIAVAPAEKTVLDHTYPLSGRLYWYKLATAPSVLNDFVAWTRSKDGAAVLTNSGCIPAK